MEQTVEEQLEMDDYVGFSKRVLITFVDFLILALPTYLLNKLSSGLTESLHSAIPLILEWGLLSAFNIWMVMKYGGTPGKLVLKARIINGSGAYPSLKEAAIRDSFSMIYSLLSVIAGVGTVYSASVSGGLSNWSPLAEGLNMLLGFFIVIDCLCVGFIQRKRALHDLMAGTYVVRKSALDRLK